MVQYTELHNNYAFSSTLNDSKLETVRQSATLGLSSVANSSADKFATARLQFFDATISSTATMLSNRQYARAAQGSLGDAVDNADAMSVVSTATSVMKGSKDPRRPEMRETRQYLRLIISEVCQCPRLTFAFYL